MKKEFYLIILSSIFLVGWGKTGHKIINQKSVESFPTEIFFLKSWSNILTDHASDADNRKSNDPTESPKHYIDIDEYSEFVSTGKIIEDYDSLVAKYGEEKIIDRGLLPWAIISTCETLKSAFENKDWDKAMLLAADLGHYVADAHMPLHITTNYNGQLTNQSGVHSRYESTMIGNYSSQIIYSGIQSEYISDIPNYVFDFIYYNYRFVDSVLIADRESKAIASGNYNNTYYESLWKKTNGFTINLFSNASYRLSGLIYTCWVNAGSPIIVGIDKEITQLNSFELFQNYPNPFNPNTTISFSIPLSSFDYARDDNSDVMVSKSNHDNADVIPNRQLTHVGDEVHVTLKVYDILGREVATLVDEQKPAGVYNVQCIMNNVSSGVYFYTLKAGSFTETKKMLLLR
jgi:hypothetical protein